MSTSVHTMVVALAVVRLQSTSAYETLTISVKLILRPVKVRVVPVID